jgi:hypothetical protein
MAFQQFRAKFVSAASRRRQTYRRVFDTVDGKFILADLMRGSGILDVDKSPTSDQAIGILARWWPVAAILNGMAMTDQQIVDWANDAAQRRANEMGDEVDHAG